jgi:hypothetical protein
LDVFLAAAHCEQSTLSSGLDPALSNCAADDFSIAIIGDLHLERKSMIQFARAREQLLSVLEGEPGTCRVVQLGDLGGYNEKPGARTSAKP